MQEKKCREKDYCDICLGCLDVEMINIDQIEVKYFNNSKMTVANIFWKFMIKRRSDYFW